MTERQRGIPQTEISGPGEVLGEAAVGFRIKVLRGELTVVEAQEEYDRVHRLVTNQCLRFPDFPWEQGSTQRDALLEEEKRLRAERAAKNQQNYPKTA